MKMVGIQMVAKFSLMNRDMIALSQKCGCFHCLKEFERKDIKEWTDNNDTAVCPFCSNECVIGDACGYEINPQSLQNAHSYWIKKD